MYYKNGFAIVGIGCRFPGGIASLDGLWDVLSKGADVVSNVPEERFSMRRYWHPDRQAPGKTCTTAAGIVGDVKQFDAAFFSMSPKEAEALDPQQRMVLESDIETVMQAYREGGEAIYEADTGLRISRYRLGNVTFWVKFTEDAEGYVINSAYSHRMTVETR